MTEREKMLAGKIYDTSDELLLKQRIHAHRMSKDYNDTYEDEEEKRAAILKDFIPNMGEDTYLQGPIQFDYGINTTFGKGCFANFNLVVLDVCPVTIGDNVFMGPNCTIATPIHPYIPEERNAKHKEDGTLYDHEYGKPITIEENCWLASDVTVCGGVTIGAGSIIGAGSVVTKDIPAPLSRHTTDYRKRQYQEQEGTVLILSDRFLLNFPNQVGMLSIFQENGDRVNGSGEF